MITTHKQYAQALNRYEDLLKKINTLSLAELEEMQRLEVQIDIYQQESEEAVMGYDSYNPFISEDR